MKITATSRGGFAGRTERIELDTRRTPDGRTLEALLDRIGFFSAAPALSIGADLRRWEITVHDGARRHVVTVTEDQLADNHDWQALLAQLRHGSPA